MPAREAPFVPVVFGVLLPSSAAEEAVMSDVGPRRMLLPPVAPSLLTRTWPVVVRFPRVILPLWLLVSPAPVLTVNVMFWLPALIVVPGAIAMTADPAWRWASTTPFAAVSLAVSATDPLFVLT